MLEVLRFLLVQFRDQRALMMQTTDDDILTEYLEDAGFEKNIIQETFAWLNELANSVTEEFSICAPQAQSLRVLHEEEAHRLSPEAFGFIINLQNLKVIDSLTREVVINLLLALDVGMLYKEHVIWVVYMLMMHRQNDLVALWMEDLINEVPVSAYH